VLKGAGSAADNAGVERAPGKQKWVKAGASKTYAELIPVHHVERFAPMFKSLKKGKRSLLLALVAVLALTAGAIAYWTAGGSGTGSGSAAGAQTPLTVNQTTTLAAMYPGDTAQTISGNFDNPNSGPIYVGTVTASIASVTKAVGAVAGTCDATDFTLANAAMTVGAEVPSGTAKGSWSGATIKFNNKAANQDQCKGATVSLAYTIS
jgi:hypothetical protein